MNEFYWLLLRNTLASWIINMEFFGPLILWLIAIGKKERWPGLVKRIHLPIVCLLAASLVKQTNYHFLSPLALYESNLQINSVYYYGYLIVYSLLYLVSGILLIRLFYINRRK